MPLTRNPHRRFIRRSLLILASSLGLALLFAAVQSAALSYDVVSAQEAQPTVVVTATPTPETVFAAATLVAEKTQQAATTGTATSAPGNWVLATKMPKPKVVTATATAKNKSTAEVMAAMETAIAVTTGTPDPSIIVVTTTPTNTPSPIPTATPTRKATPTSVIVTPTARPANVLAAATLVAKQTAKAQQEGTATPLPDNWKIARVVVAPNAAMAVDSAAAAAAVAEQTAIAVTTGQPADVVVWTATPRPTQTPKPTSTATQTNVIVTPTAAPADVFEAATRVAEQTAEADMNGTATPLPGNWQVALVVVAPNGMVGKSIATTTASVAKQTAIAATTAQPAHIVIWTATPPPVELQAVNQQAEQPEPTPTNVYITPTPKPANVIAAATAAADLTAQAKSKGTATPLPRNWKVARVAVAPNPGEVKNQATAVAAAAQGTAIALTTAMPENVVVWTATPRPPATDQPTRTPTPFAIPLAEVTPTPETFEPGFPKQLVGKILFLSDIHSGRRTHPDAFAMNADGTEIVRLTSTTFYDRANERDATSADGRFYAHALKEESGTREIQIFYDDYLYGTKKQLTYHGDGVAWDAAWSPVADRVAYVSSQSGNDEIWIGRPDQWPSQQLTDNDWEWDHSPSWSPDGSQIVFSSNRDDGKQQIWIMAADGGDPRPLLDLPFEAWGPIWVKYAD